MVSPRTCSPHPVLLQVRPTPPRRLPLTGCRYRVFDIRAVSWLDAEGNTDRTPADFDPIHIIIGALAGSLHLQLYAVAARCSSACGVARSHSLTFLRAVWCGILPCCRPLLHFTFY